MCLCVCRTLIKPALSVLLRGGKEVIYHLFYLSFVCLCVNFMHLTSLIMSDYVKQSSVSKSQCKASDTNSDAELVIIRDLKHVMWWVILIQAVQHFYNFSVHSYTFMFLFLCWVIATKTIFTSWLDKLNYYFYTWTCNISTQSMPPVPFSCRVNLLSYLYSFLHILSSGEVSSWLKMAEKSWHEETSLVLFFTHVQ